ncbi:hypothetical protein B0H17DRAFT_1146159 [Mycena rosella]|uniref:Uncharacterized protein n=1 Tax=Mycena rosella TaxID=1033263 RepID=A0AAD7CQ93_MYCRO|nr:hypothetical protein B0H17DRAFT_1146159 [Mycena rosella]
MPQSYKHPHPHSPDLLRNRNPLRPLGPFDAKVAALAQIGAEHFFITTHTDYVPAIPLLHLPHKLYLREDMRYGTDDFTLWPQQFAQKYCHLLFIAAPGSHPGFEVMWWTPTKDDFKVGSAVTRGLGRLKHAQFQKFLPPINELVDRCKDLRRTSPALCIALFGQIIGQIVMCVEQLETLPTTYPKLLFAVASLQSAFLELDTLYNYMTIYKKRIEDYLTPSSTDTVGCFVGVFTSVPTVAQQLWVAGCPCWFVRGYEFFDEENILEIVPLREPSFELFDPEAHRNDAPPVLYSDNTTLSKIAAIHRAARETPWYRDPFETSTRVRSPSPGADAPVAVASGSRSAAGSDKQQRRAHPCTFFFTCDILVHVADGSPDPQQNPNPAKRAANAVANGGKNCGKKNIPHMTAAPAHPAPVERDRFAHLNVPHMPPSIVSWADALAAVNRAVAPSNDQDADKRYVMPEPALLVHGTPERRRMYLHHWNVLADCVTWMLRHDPQLLSTQEWKDILEGLITVHGHSNSRTYKRGAKVAVRLRPALIASNVSNVEGVLPVAPESCPKLSLEQTHETIWLVAETGFRFEFCALDRRASSEERVDSVKQCFAGHMLIARLMLKWSTKTRRPDIIQRINQTLQWSVAEMEALEQAMCRYYTQAFWEYFGHAAVVPLHLAHDVTPAAAEL